MKLEVGDNVVSWNGGAEFGIVKSIAPSGKSVSIELDWGFKYPRQSPYAWHKLTPGQLIMVKAQAKDLDARRSALIDAINSYPTQEREP